MRISRQHGRLSGRITSDGLREQLSGRVAVMRQASHGQDLAAASCVVEAPHALVSLVRLGHGR